MSEMKKKNECKRKHQLRGFFHKQEKKTIQQFNNKQADRESFLVQV